MSEKQVEGTTAIRKKKIFFTKFVCYNFFAQQHLSKLFWRFWKAINPSELDPSIWPAFQTKWVPIRNNFGSILSSGVAPIQPQFTPMTQDQPKECTATTSLTLSPKRLPMSWDLICEIDWHLHTYFYRFSCGVVRVAKNASFNNVFWCDHFRHQKCQFIFKSLCNETIVVDGFGLLKKDFQFLQMECSNSIISPNTLHEYFHPNKLLFGWNWSASVWFFETWDDDTCDRPTFFFWLFTTFAQSLLLLLPHFF